MNITLGSSEPSLWGIDASLWINGASVIVAVVIAAFLTPWLAGRSARRDQQEKLLRTLLNTWQTVANPDYQSAIALIVVDFKGRKNILKARQELLDLVNSPMPDEETLAAKRFDDNRRLQAELITAIANELDFDITAAELIGGAYISQGFVTRENVIFDGFVAWQRIAAALEENNRMFAATLAAPENEGKPEDGTSSN